MQRWLYTHRRKTFRIVLKGVTKQQPVLSLLARAMSSESYTTLNVTRPREYVVHVEMNRPDKRNAMNGAFFSEIGACFQKLSDDSDCRVVVLSGAGKIFTAGLDLMDLGNVIAIRESEKTDIGRKAVQLRKFLTNWQENFSQIEKCGKPVIAAIHSACVGGGVDLTSACDVRYCSEDAWFQIKEIDLGLAADLGTLQRFPKVIGNDSYARELAFTARKFYADEAKQMGFVSRILPDKDSLLDAALDMAALIASKSPIAVQGTKASMVYSRDHSVQEGLEHIGIWNQSMLQSSDMTDAAMAQMQKKEAKFSKL
ncbi:delta(3,5)-Delta(2,4)-dienoyl-CoA isomerase, mitochondrial-like isoform X3 [Mercenaria mercenaria]|uniref:delta(3,5)-Delta(2,4)-dienoyl-CoA isomerase, mitochondrial-like isoform X3 n=1 Tax=Mercenaria mercenaria TaxID=6596 RepID=UPI00234F1270|nr:delta(3,5)-Delta(2,4)-dienoyl-CoA isomerase, mitochondrial-like isoform X3 [Mercenaria mercenaria]